MACFIVPVTEAVVTTVAAKVLKSKEEKALAHGASEDAPKIRFSTKLGWLNKLLWGGSVLLAFEHLWHGEIVPWFPFLTAASDPTETAAMLHEMATVGVSMAILVTMVWVAMLAVSSAIEKRSQRADAETAKEGASE